ncbi:transcription factor S [Candidatus Woesearchaeota archaeon]|nr:transcription factor S [Candidatus Woesearchaeota archaeon]
MMFCPKCGSLMTPKQEKGKKFFACSCGYTNKKGTQPSIVKEIVKEKPSEEMPDIITEEISILPLTEETCPKCKHDQAHWWTKQMRASDEPETKFLKCEKCKYTWRDRS